MASLNKLPTVFKTCIQNQFAVMDQIEKSIAKINRQSYNRAD